MNSLESVVIWLLLGSLAVNVVFAMNLSVTHGVTLLGALACLLREIVFWPVTLIKSLLAVRSAVKNKRDHSSW